MAGSMSPSLRQAELTGPTSRLYPRSSSTLRGGPRAWGSVITLGSSLLRPGPARRQQVVIPSRANDFQWLCPTSDNCKAPIFEPLSLLYICGRGEPKATCSVRSVQAGECISRTLRGARSYAMAPAHRFFPSWPFSPQRPATTPIPALLPAPPEYTTASRTASCGRPADRERCSSDRCGGVEGHRPPSWRAT
jgi:hypothetical protein